MAMLADMAAGKQVFRIHNDNPDRTACRTISIKSPPLRGGEKPHCVLNKKPSGRGFKEHHAVRLGKSHPDEGMETVVTKKLNNQIHLHIHSAKGDGQLRSPPLHWRLRKEKRTRC